MKTIRTFAVLPMVLAGSLLVAACSSPAPTTDIDTLPPSLQGNLVNPVLLYPPYGFEGDDGELTGVYTEMSNALAQELGLTVENKQDSFENMLTGVQSGKYVWMVAAEVTEERLQAFDWVYFNDTYAAIVGKADGPELAEEESALCGYTVGALSASTQAEALRGISDDCEADGAKPVTVSEYKDLASSILAIQSGQADFFAGDSVSLIDVVAGDDSLTITGPQITRNKVAIALTKGSGAAEVVAAGLNKLIENGTYLDLLTKYQMEGTAITESVVNPQP